MRRRCECGKVYYTSSVAIHPMYGRCLDCRLKASLRIQDLEEKEGLLEYEPGDSLGPPR